MSIKQFIVSAVAVLGVGFMGQVSAYDYQQVKGDMMHSRIYTLKKVLSTPRLASASAMLASLPP